MFVPRVALRGPTDAGANGTAVSPPMSLPPWHGAPPARISGIHGLGPPLAVLTGCQSWGRKPAAQIRAAVDPRYHKYISLAQLQAALSLAPPARVRACGVRDVRCNVQHAWHAAENLQPRTKGNRRHVGRGCMLHARMQPTSERNRL